MYRKFRFGYASYCYTLELPVSQSVTVNRYPIDYWTSTGTLARSLPVVPTGICYLHIYVVPL